MGLGADQRCREGFATATPEGFDDDSDPPDVGRLVSRAAAGRYPEIAVMTQLAVITDARRGELCELRWTDLDNKRAELLIQRSIFETMEHEVIEKETKTHQARRIALDEGTMATLASHRAAWKHAQSSAALPSIRRATCSPTTSAASSRGGRTV